MMQLIYNKTGLQLSCIVRKPAFGICENKGADQLRGSASLFVAYAESQFSHDAAHIQLYAI